MTKTFIKGLTLFVVLFCGSTIGLAEDFAPNFDASTYYPLTRSIRLIDTRPNSRACSTTNKIRVLSGGFNFPISAITECEGVVIPSEAIAIVGTVTSVNTLPDSTDGHATIHSEDIERPNTSNLNFKTGQIVSNAFTTKLSSKGSFIIHSTSSSDFIVDVVGYYVPRNNSQNGLYFHPLPQAFRLLDTRNNDEPAHTKPGYSYWDKMFYIQNAHVTYQGITIPKEAKVLVGNITAVNPPKDGYITLYSPENAYQPITSNLNYSTGKTVGTGFTTNLSTDGTFIIFLSAPTDFIIDVVGYYSEKTEDINGQGMCFTPLRFPRRILDTRSSSPLSGGQEYTHEDRIGFRAEALVGNLTVTNTHGAGHAVLYPQSPKPYVTNINYELGQTVASAFTLKLNNNKFTDYQAFTIYPITTTDAIVDITGYYTTWWY
jgi:hypothetical protein